MPTSLILSVVLGGIVAFAGAAHAAADPVGCTNDIDCTSSAACGTTTCDWSQGMTCKPAGGTNKGWCAKDSDCKCMGVGAVCNVPYCSFTTPPTGGGGTSGGTAGTTGTAGAGSAGTTGTAGAGTAGTTGTAGAGTAGTTGTAGASTTGAAGTGASSSSGGCSVTATSTSGGLAALVGLALVAGRIVRRRRRG